MTADHTQNRIATGEVETIAEWLGGDSLHLLLNAKERLDRDRSQAVEILRDLMQQDIRAYRASKRRFWILALIGSVLVALAMGFHPLLVTNGSTWAAYLLLPGWLVMPFLIAWYCAHQSHKRRLRNTVALLRRYESVQAIGALIEAMECGDGETAYQAESVLALLLREIRPENRALLTAAHHEMLHRPLRGCNANLILAILHAFEQVGAPEDIPSVRRLTTCPEWIARSTLIRATAQRCLMALQERAARHQDERTYLRVAAAPPVPVSLLLRATPENSPILLSELLRATPSHDPP